MCSRWLWNVWYPGCSTLKIRERFRLFLANQCDGTKSFDNSRGNNHPTIFFSQNCGWYKTFIFSAHLLNTCHKLNATIQWRPHDLSPHRVVELQQLWLTLAGESPFSINSVASSGDCWHRFGMFGMASWLCVNVALPWVTRCQEYFESLKRLRKL